jgi:hypothetical protein
VIETRITRVRLSSVLLRSENKSRNKETRTERKRERDREQTRFAYIILLEIIVLKTAELIFSFSSFCLYRHSFPFVMSIRDRHADSNDCLFVCLLRKAVAQQ